MNPRTCKPTRSGQTLLELMMVISITGLLTATGLYLLHALLWRQQVNAARHADSAELLEMIGQLQAAVDASCVNPFSNEPWMWMETGQGEQWHPVIHLEVLIVRNGKPVRWEWDAPERFTILVNHPGGSWFGTDRPDMLYLKFPDSSILLLREGIAIEGFSETILLE